ncbi:6-phospho-beta-glucosidase [Mollicutes bacterium LVI A0078]|nr:6-phospho-beta-glucosidase [Mollicutes bacterium LVI A0075]WOO91242.1 6-phospho-beta-glucosidase [Mollicutes bacterium LVI A0078]
MNKQGIKIATIGGGSSYTAELIEGFIKRYEQLPVREIWLVDVEAGKEKQDIVYKLAKRMIENAGVPIELHQTLDRRAAIKDADFVTTQLRVGQLDARVLDERIPLSHGLIGQETNGAGGLFKGLRTIPVIFDIINDINELSPDAWLINFANPAGMVTEAVNRFTDFKRFIGVCNVPISMKMEAAKALDADVADCEMDLFGLNHMVYMKDFFVNGESKFDELIRRVTSDDNDSQTVKNIVNLGFETEFIKSLNMIPCPYHRYYYKEKEMTAIELGEFYKGETRAEVVKRVEAELFELYKDEDLKIKPPQLDERGGAHYSDAACEVINAIYNDLNSEQYVNIPNNGHVTNIPADWAIEISATIGKEGATPVDRIREYDNKVLGLISSIKAFEIEASKAAITGDYHTALMAMNMNPLIHSDQDARIILDEMLEAHKQYLPNFEV